MIYMRAKRDTDKQIIHIFNEQARIRTISFRKYLRKECAGIIKFQYKEKAGRDPSPPGQLPSANFYLTVSLGTDESEPFFDSVSTRL